jgi:hypothetical protein
MKNLLNDSTRNKKYDINIDYISIETDIWTQYEASTSTPTPNTIERGIRDAI